jgi:putative Holliday junction resolvase
MTHDRSRPAGRVLALDPGRMRTGIALSDPEGLLASPLETVSGRPRELVDHVLDLIARHEVVVVVIGLPRLPSGDEGEIASLSRDLADRIGRGSGATVVLRDEALTSWEAQGLLRGEGRRRGRGGRADPGEVDRLAATLILQDYLDELRRTRGQPGGREEGQPDAPVQPEA